MGKIFAISELMTFAIKIEEMGIAFYGDMVKKTKNKDAKELYTMLAKDEVQHKEIFQGFMSEVDKETSPGTYSDEYNSYMRALVESTVFRKDDKARASIASDADAIEFAIGKEKDSILFYIGMKEYVPEKDRAMVDKIIDEERSHVIKLLDIKEKIS